MSRSKEGKDLINDQSNAGASQRNDSTTGQTGTTSLDERLGSRGQTDYAAGRESYSDFPRRSRVSGRGETHNQPRAGGHRSRGGESYDNEARGGGISRYRENESFSRQGRSREDSGDIYSRGIGDRSQESGSYDRGSRFGSPTTEDYQRRGGRGHEGRGQYRSGEGRGRDRGDFGSGQSRMGERSFDYDRESRGYNDYGREDYSEPYNREATSGRHGNYEPAGLYDTGTDYGYDRRGRERNYLRTGDIMTKNVTTCSPQSPIREVADKMEDDDVGSIPVVENGRLVGIVTDRDIVCRILAEGRDTHTAVAAEAMSDDLIICSPDDTVIEAIRKMGKHQIRRMPICDMNGRLRGIVSTADIALEAENDQELADALEEISAPTPNRAKRG